MAKAKQTESAPVEGAIRPTYYALVELHGANYAEVNEVGDKFTLEVSDDQIEKLLEMGYITEEEPELVIE